MVGWDEGRLGGGREGEREGEGVLLMYSCGAGGEKGRVWIFRIRWKNDVDECVVSVGDREGVESYT